MSEYGVPEMQEYLKVADSDTEGSVQASKEWIKNNPDKVARIIWYFEDNMRKLMLLNTKPENVR